MTSIDEIMEEARRWHRDHPWRSRWARLRGRTRGAWRTVRRQPHWTVQRARRGYSDRDLWGFDRYICRVIGNACIELKGSPGWPGTDSFPTLEGWHAFLDGIAEPLLAYSDGGDDWTEETYEEAQAALHRFAANLGWMWD